MMSKNYLIINIVFFVFVLFFSSCASFPRWVKGPLTYEEDEYLYVIGYSAPTLYRHDAEKYATDNARVEMAKVINVRVKQTTVDLLTSSGKIGSTSSFVSLSEIDVDEIVKNSEPIAVWYDEKGDIKDKGAAFALIRIKKAFLNQKTK
ncbi:MAG: hypothetical protein ABH873_04800 [Candidatus Firestonebacteria bacterium]